MIVFDGLILETCFVVGTSTEWLGFSTVPGIRMSVFLTRDLVGVMAVRREMQFLNFVFSCNHVVVTTEQSPVSLFQFPKATLL